MSSGNLYPPQAFTREMLSQAFVWLQTQPESVRELARNPESLISIYLRNQRSQLFNQKKMENQSSNPHADAPVSAQNFMTDLKSLAEGLKQFDEPTPVVSAATSLQNLPPLPNQSAGPGAHQSFAAQLRNEMPPPRQTQTQQSMQQHVQQQQTLQQQHLQQQKQTTQQQAQHQTNPQQQQMAQAGALPVSSQLNSNSQYMIREVKEKFNLSSDHEALNMLVAIAYKNLKSLID